MYTRLHEALAERGRAEHQRAVVVLKGAGHDFGRRGGSAVGQHDKRNVARERLSFGDEALHVAASTHAGHFLALRQEQVRGGDGLVENATRVTAQVEDNALGAADRAAS